MSGLKFAFADLIQEIESLQAIAGEFIAPESTGVLPRLKGTLEQIQDSSASVRTRWEIRADEPLRTTISRGAYQPDEEGEYNVFAELSFLWEIKPVRKKKVAKHFELDGIASIVIALFQEQPDPAAKPRALGRWKVEVGDHKSPGCHFHVQLNGDEPEPPFPKGLDVPRLPALAISPMLAFESVVAELFQDRWRSEATRETAEFQMWNSIHRERLLKFLDWQALSLRERSGTPWSVLKQVKPAADQLL